MSGTALIVVDMINSYEFEEADKLVRSVEDSLAPMQRISGRAQDEGVLTIYVNDNFGAWRSSRQELVETALNGPYGRLVEPIAPPDDALFVVKARHSIFYQTPLEYLLRQEGVDRLVLIGQVTEQCIVYSALDAYIRHFPVAVPSDAVAHIHENLADASLEMMERNMDAEICKADDCKLR